MKVFKFLFFLLLIFLIGSAIYFASKDGRYDIKESRLIEIHPSILYNTVNDYKTWEHWGPWKKEDSTMTFSYNANTVGVGGGYSWDGEFPGSMKTTAVQENVAIEQNLTLETPGGERSSKVGWEFTPKDNGVVEVSWKVEGEHTLMDKVYFAFSGTDFEGDMRTMYTSGLEGLETYVREQMEDHEVTIHGITEHGGGFYLYKTTSASGTNISTIMGKNYGEIDQFMKQKGMTQSGMPFTIYNEMNPNGSIIMSNAIPVPNAVDITEDSTVLSGYLPRTKAVRVSLQGDYTYLGKAWAEAMQYITQYKLTQSEQKPFEIYTNDPGNYPNPADWTTDIYIPIE
ncbi:GyrI-like domain-containing protein [uncultured Dokdonia sp.]|uniref:SRPBCC family protein n=1 Tax=uncultured Dokdonia sp. TaxID=575653 RepID=UPI00260B0925|nr:GyrI-like domain-containing protein [uncultured Dokdonia sp.]